MSNASCAGFLGERAVYEQWRVQASAACGARSFCKGTSAWLERCPRIESAHREPVAHAKLPHRHKFLFLALGSALLLVLGAAAGFIVLLSGAYSIAATKQHFTITHRILELGLRYSVATSARNIEVPDLARHADVELGQACYRKHCEQCHGAPGIARGPVGQGQLPSPS